jgi:hypothetical protein
MSPWLYYTLATLLVLGGAVCWLANLLSLPGNWGLVALAGLFGYLVPMAEGRGVAWTTVWALLGLAVAGEIVEFAAGAMGAAKQGASRRAVAYSLVGALAGSIGGAIVGLPIPIVGPLAAALLGGSVGAFAGAYLGERKNEGSHATGMAVGRSAFWGRLWGTVGKFVVGAVMLGVLAVDAFL